ncbi:high frequency lysogenization protein HflD [Catenovulum sp. 2E275]|uniref:high frequency lysogenization protein HflD n=1 Tax=Catenovulum sp. 2E275 TaxID=2980497 RepID=UPI0021CF33C2|nr:high frequency lysogenization protein HflD [Catenovulum sp. 2E275]MCU4674556.1 high frequency lysogenization protein HflD [Catenovulum sp. 2E275]
MAQVTFQQTLALAGVCQACYMVQTIARRGALNEPELATMLESVLNTSPENAEAVYGGADKLLTGFKIIREQLGNNSHVKDAELTRYVLSALTLERRLNKRKGSLQQLSKQISLIEQKRAHFELTHELVLEGFAQAYKQVISPLGSPIKVLGNPDLLKQNSVQNKVRALLLAAVRSAVLWRQSGGQRRNIVFRRQQWVHYAEQALKQYALS